MYFLDDNELIHIPPHCSVTNYNIIPPFKSIETSQYHKDVPKIEDFSSPQSQKQVLVYNCVSRWKRKRGIVISILEAPT